MAHLMSKAVKKPTDRANSLMVTRSHDVSEARAQADLGIDAAAAAMITVQRFNKGSFGDQSITDTYEAIQDQVAKVAAGDLSEQRAMLVSQSVSLNAIFTEMARRAALNMGEYPETMQLYMRLAFKAQAQSRTTIEALDRITNGHEQLVKHIHVDNRGGQAIIAENVHTGGQNGKAVEQSHATGSIEESAQVLGTNTVRDEMSVANCERQEAVPNAWRD